MSESFRPDRGPLYRSPAELRKLPAAERNAILEQMAIIAEPLYREGGELRVFEANEVLDYPDELPPPTIYADFDEVDALGRIRLNSERTIRDLVNHRLTRAEGLIVMLSDGDDLETEGKLTFSDEERSWVAVIDRNAIPRR